MEINIIEILLYIVNIVILFFFLRWLLYKPITKFLANRTNEIQKQIDEAAQKYSDAEQLKARYDEMMHNAQDLATELINKGKTVADAAGAPDCRGSGRSGGRNAHAYGKAY